MLIRRFAAEDHEPVRRVHAEAFRRSGEPGTPVEVAILDGLIAAGDVIDPLSLVAVDDDAVVGHVVCSRATVGAHAVVGLGPIGVLPDRQRAGVGSALMHAVLAAADALDVPLVGLLGSREYYPRFGFVPSREVGVEPPARAWGDLFQVRTLSAYDPAIAGAFRYAPAFDLA